MQDVTVVNVSFNYYEKGEAIKFMPLQALYIVAILEKNNYNITFKDYLVGSITFDDPRDPQNLVHFVKDTSEIIVFNCLSDGLPLVILASKEVKDRHPEKIIILSGIGPTGVADEVLQRFPFIDFVIKGEVEETLIDLLANMHNDLTKIPGISYNNNGKSGSNPLRKRIRNLDKLPFPAYYKASLEDYTVLEIIMGRGCPHRCSFCDVSPFWGNQYVKRTLDSGIEEIKLLLSKTKDKMIFIGDETFTVNKIKVLEFCERIRKEKLKFKWSCATRIDEIDEELMKEMSASGCQMVFYGIESASDKILEKIKKGFTKRRAEEVISKSLTYFDVNTFFIYGFPFESMDNFNDTLGFISTLSKIGVYPIIYAFSPLPNSPIYEEYKNKLNFSQEWSTTCWLNNQLHSDKTEEVLSLIQQHPTIFSRFYSLDERITEKYNIISESGLETQFQF